MNDSRTLRAPHRAMAIFVAASVLISPAAAAPVAALGSAAVRPVATWAPNKATPDKKSQADKAKANAQKAKANAQKAKANAQRAKANAQKAKSNAQRAKAIAKSRSRSHAQRSRHARGVGNVDGSLPYLRAFYVYNISRGYTPVQIEAELLRRFDSNHDGSLSRYERQVANRMLIGYPNNDPSGISRIAE